MESLLLCCHPLLLLHILLQVLDGVTPQVQFVKIVNDELVELMGSSGSKDLNPGQPQVILMAGLQASCSSTELPAQGRASAALVLVCIWLSRCLQWTSVNLHH